MEAGSPSAKGQRIEKEGGLRDRLRKVEADILLTTISDAGGDRRLAAQRLGISLSSLYRKLEKLEPQ